MSDDYTPSLATARAVFIDGAQGEFIGEDFDRMIEKVRAEQRADREPSDAELDATYEAFRAHDRGEEFNELGEHVCSECGYAYSWPTGDPVIQVSPHRRRQRHKARAALLAAQEVRHG